MSETIEQSITPEPSTSEAILSGKVLVTGGSGFVGSNVVRELLAKGYEPVCLARHPESCGRLVPREQRAKIHAIQGDVFDAAALDRAAQGCAAAIHLIGIIEENRLLGQTFERIHVDGTRAVVDACVRAGIQRYAHMSALGTWANAVSMYHQTKWAAEEIVRGSPLKWTIFRPSMIHGPDGEFMQMMKFFSTSKIRQPFMPYFGSGTSQIQPVSVKDVAVCFVRCLSLPETISKVFELGGPERLTWKELYDVCAQTIAGHTRIKVSVPVAIAKIVARTIMPITPRLLVPYRFNVAQVLMSQEDSTCNTAPVEQTFGIKLRDFRTELSQYADQIE